MVKIHNIEFETDDMTAEELKSKIGEIIDRAIENDKKEIKMYDAFIKAIVELTKVVVGDRTFDRTADKLRDYLLKCNVKSRRSFYLCYRRAVEDVVDDITCLAREHKEISLDKTPSSNEKRKKKVNSIKTKSKEINKER